MHVGVAGGFRPTDHLSWIIDGGCCAVTAAQIAKVYHASIDEHNGIDLRVAGKNRFAYDNGVAVNTVSARHVPAKRAQILHAMHRVPKKGMIELFTAGYGRRPNDLPLQLLPKA